MTDLGSRSLQHVVAAHSLCAFIGFALIALVQDTPLVGLPLIDDVTDRLDPPRGFLPANTFHISFTGRTLRNPLLLTDCLAKTRKKCLVVAQIGGRNAATGALSQLPLVLAAIPHQLVELVLCLDHASLVRGQTGRQTTLGVIDEVLDRGKTFGAIHDRTLEQ
jgi:hypothetical protein